MNNEFKNRQLEKKLQNAPYYPLENDAKDRIQKALLSEAKKHDDQLSRNTRYKRSTVWLTSIAAVILFSIIAIGNMINSNSQYGLEKSSMDDAGSPDMDMDLDTAEEESSYEEPVSEGEMASPNEDNGTEMPSGSPGDSDSDSNSNYTWEINQIDEQDRNIIEEWINQEAMGPTRTYEINDDNSNRHVMYAFSSIYNHVEVQEVEEGVIKLLFSTKEQIADDTVLVKVEFNPNVIHSFVLDEKITPDHLKRNQFIAMSKQEVQGLLGPEYTDVEAAKNGEDVWRYDFGKEEGYVPQNIEGSNGVPLDFIDTDGLEEGFVESQLFIQWTEDETIKYFAFYWWNEENQSVEEYRENEN